MLPRQNQKGPVWHSRLRPYSRERGPYSAKISICENVCMSRDWGDQGRPRDNTRVANHKGMLSRILFNAFTFIFYTHTQRRTI
jgi:hypothetical protein